MIDDINKVLSSFKIKATCIDAKKHRHFAYYDLVLQPGTRINSIQRYADELALAIKANSSFIIKPIPNLGIVRIQTTLKESDCLDFNSLYKQHEIPKNQLMPLLLGETNEGQPLWMDMSKNPHLLVAGSTGSGKSVFLHTLIANSLKRNDILLYLIDTKMVEFNNYFGKNTNVVSIDSDPEMAIRSLMKLNNLMNLRYEHMAKVGIKSIEDCPNIFSKILIIIDESADLMLSHLGKVFENLIVKLAQKARAAGIYIVLATQRPSVDVFTGLIKTNFPARLACKVSSKVDSKVILDRHGAENLIGRGDAILNNSDFDMVRFQVAYNNSTL